MPAWMALLHGAVSDASVPHYVRLFLTKAVLHVDKRHVARTGADPALQVWPDTPLLSKHLLPHPCAHPFLELIYFRGWA